jgi:HSP20 family protein
MALRSLIPFGRSGNLARGEDTDPFTALRREVDRMFDDFTQGWALPATFRSDGFISPKVDVAETDKGLELTAELPGIDEKDIDLELVEGVLTLKAEHKTEREEQDEKRKYHLVERSYGTFMRRFTLPFEADEDKVEARFDKGVLHVFVPRSAAARARSRKIAIRGGASGSDTARKAA